MIVIVNICRSVDYDYAMNKLSESILKWSSGKERILNLISPPYNTSMMLTETILEYLKTNRKVLYITGEEEKHIEILDFIKKCTKFKDYIYLRRENTSVRNLLTFSNHYNSEFLNMKFDLIVYDNIRSYPEHDGYEIRALVSRLNANKKIIYSVDSLFDDRNETIVPIRENRKPMPEPRVILTRIDLNKDIPFVVYEYLDWSIKLGRKVVIYQPSKQEVKKMYYYLCNFKEKLSKNIMCFIQNESDEKVVMNFLQTKKSIIVTNDYSETYLDLHDIDVIVYFADDSRFDYSKLLYLCGKAGREENQRGGEVIFLANEETEEMERTKDIARSFNKEAWERGLFKL